MKNANLNFKFQFIAPYNRLCDKFQFAALNSEQVSLHCGENVLTKGFSYAKMTKKS